MQRPFQILSYGKFWDFCEITVSSKLNMIFSVFLLNLPKLKCEQLWYWIVNENWFIFDLQKPYVSPLKSLDFYMDYCP